MDKWQQEVIAVTFLVKLEITNTDIGPQGIVHGTTLTVLNAGRKYLKTEDLSGKVTKYWK